MLPADLGVSWDSPEGDRGERSWASLLRLLTPGPPPDRRQEATLDPGPGLPPDQQGGSPEDG